MHKAKSIKIVHQKSLNIFSFFRRVKYFDQILVNIFKLLCKKMCIMINFICTFKIFQIGRNDNEFTLHSVSHPVDWKDKDREGKSQKGNGNPGSLGITNKEKKKKSCLHIARINWKKSCKILPNHSIKRWDL